jgi:hypothetical protein
MERSSINKKAIETIKIIGNQVIEIRELLTQQTEAIQLLKHEFAKVKAEANSTAGDLKMIQIDQRDISSQMKRLKDVAGRFEDTMYEMENTKLELVQASQVDNETMSELSKLDDLLALDERSISRKYYNNYDTSKVVKMAESSRRSKEEVKPTPVRAVADVHKETETSTTESVNSEMIQDNELKTLDSDLTKTESNSFNKIPRLLNF